MVTAYDAPSGRLADEAGADLVLVGDSAAMTVLGHDSTVPATMDEMIVLTRAVTRGARRPLVIADMPFGSFQVSDAEALENAIRFVKESGADAVKLEGAGPTLTRVAAIVGAGIPVMGHVGLTPQSATMLGGFKAQGRTAEKAARMLSDALALEAAGCFSIVLEAVPRTGGGGDHAAAHGPDDRHRRRRRDRRPGARVARPARALRRHVAAVREALRRSRDGDPRRGLGVRVRRPRAPVPGGRPHVRDRGGGARGVPGGRRTRRRPVEAPRAPSGGRRRRRRARPRGAARRRRRATGAGRSSAGRSRPARATRRRTQARWP